VRSVDLCGLSALSFRWVFCIGQNQVRQCQRRARTSGIGVALWVSNSHLVQKGCANRATWTKKRSGKGGRHAGCLPSSSRSVSRPRRRSIQLLELLGCSKPDGDSWTGFTISRAAVHDRVADQKSRRAGYSVLNLAFVGVVPSIQLFPGQHPVILFPRLSAFRRPQISSAWTAVMTLTA